MIYVGCGWCIVISTPQIKHISVSKPLLQDSRQLEKPHLLFWHKARPTKKKKKLKMRGGDGLEGSGEVKERLSARGGGWGLKKKTTAGVQARASVFQLKLSLTQKRLNRPADLLSSSLRASCLCLPGRNPLRPLRAKSHLALEPCRLMN